MKVTLADPIRYELLQNDQATPLNPLLGQTISLEHSGDIHCINCGRHTKKSFNQGYCYPCFTRLAQCDSCIIKPENCHYHLGTCREPQWGEDNCFQDHIIYLANSSGIKVGITRHNQVPTRWIDQGASQALPIFRVNTRRVSGAVEVAFKEFVADKTHWQKMLKGPAEPQDLLAKRDELLPQVTTALDRVKQDIPEASISLIQNPEPLSLSYPVLEYPVKVTSLNFDKTPIVSGTLLGIKGQYLIFDTGVINIRKFGGYRVTLSV